MATWIERFDVEAGPASAGGAPAPRVAVKDLIDVAGHPTTAGSRAVAATAPVADADAGCVARVRAAGGRLAGKANLHELAFGGTGVNPWFGTPVNPLDPLRIPGGSSSGCAVAVATGEADVAVGTDTAGSVRTPSACCGTVGLKTTWGRIPLDGVRPLAPSLDTVGPMARDVGGVAQGLAMLDPAFDAGAALAADPVPVVGRVRVPGTDPLVDEAVDRALAAAGVEVVEVALPGWRTAAAAGVTVLFGEAWLSNRALVETGVELGADVADRIATGRRIRPADLDAARRRRTPWRRELSAAFARAPVLALPALLRLPALLDDPAQDTRTTNVPVNLAGHPALVLPLPTGGPLPAGLQLVAPDGREDVLVATGAHVEAAVRP